MSKTKKITVEMKHFADDDDSEQVDQVVYDAAYEKNSFNDRLHFDISEFYTVDVYLFISDTDKASFFVVESHGEGTEAKICLSRLACLDQVVKTYGAPHNNEFMQLVGRLLPSTEDIKKAEGFVAGA